MSAITLLAKLAGARIALPARHIGQVIEIDMIVPVPHAPPAVLGLTAVRSQPMTLVDCRQLLGLSRTEEAQRARAVVLNLHGHHYALLLEEILEVVALEHDVEPLPYGVGEQWERVASGTVETAAGPALLIEPEALLSGLVAAAA
jgi:purine-binding chemotaxis protein CheW